MCQSWQKRAATINPVYGRLVPRTYNCWMSSHFGLASEFASALQLPAGSRVVFGVVVHAYIQTEFPLFYEKAFMAWKGNFGYAAVPDNGFNNGAIYPAERQWVFDWVLTSTGANRFYPSPPNGCVCCVGQTQYCPENPY